MSIPQGIRDLVKNARRLAKQTFIRLETRVLRPDKMKIQQLESGVRGQGGGVGQLEAGVRGEEREEEQLESGERGQERGERVRRKLRPHPPLQQTAHEESYFSFAPF